NKGEVASADEKLLEVTSWKVGYKEELLVDEALNDDDILESMVDITKDLETVDSEPEEDVTPLTKITSGRPSTFR
ncbi:hypothetical protein TNCV_1749441, partial [Trichonephila clavipes]